MLTPRPVELTTRDAVHIAALHWDSGLRDAGCVVAHGFTGSSRAAPVQRICRALAGQGFGVLAPDLRGHGLSGGRSTAGALEIHDVAAAVEWLRASGYVRVAVLGWSMGGSAVLRYAGLGVASDASDACGASHGHSAVPADAVVSVAPGRWFERGTRPMRIVHFLCETRRGRLVLRLARRTRMAVDSWADVPESPSEVVGRIGPTPLLIVHGDADHYFPLAHAEELQTAAPSADVWIEPGMRHAETATDDDLLERIGQWVRRALSGEGARTTGQNSRDRENLHG